MYATNFVLYSAGTLLCALSIYAFLAAICKMVLSFSSVIDAADLAEENERLEQENEDLQEQIAQVYTALVNSQTGEEILPASEVTADDVEAEAEEAGGCNGNGCCGHGH